MRKYSHLKSIAIIALSLLVWVSCKKIDKKAVDLGLPSGTLWANCNVGADTCWGIGDYFAWGETADKEYYSWSNYKYMEPGDFDYLSDPEMKKEYLQINKYQIPDRNYGIWYDVKFIGDGKKILDSIDDAASTQWGGDWCMPTADDFQELIDNCAMEWIYNYDSTGVDVLVFIGNGDTIFFPHMSHCYDSGMDFCCYWSRVLYRTERAWCFSFASAGDFVISNSERWDCLLIRPICPNRGDVNGHEAVNLGLPSGNLWATCNVGSNKPYEYGGNFAWGEIDSVDELSNYESYKFITHTDGESRFNEKYNKYQIADGETRRSWYYVGDFVGDWITILDSNDDAATVNWGENWEMPTDVQFKELMNECFWVWTKQYDSTQQAGYIVYKAKNDSDKGKRVMENESQLYNYSLSDTHIFLPAGGEEPFGYVNFYGFYWTKNLSKKTEKAFCLSFGEVKVTTEDRSRGNGFSVRPVYKH